jgi:acetolactate synthase-1/2/3 large subunit
MQACQQMCEVLIEAGIDHVFGIPGGGTGPLFNAIHDHRDKIRFILTRHEQAASIMADVYGRLTGKPGVLLGQGVFIGSSGAFGIMEAFMSSSPMIALTDTSEAGVFAQHGSYQGHRCCSLPPGTYAAPRSQRLKRMSSRPCDYCYGPSAR